MRQEAKSGEVEIVRVPTNVLAENDVQAFMDQVLDQLGHIDYAANCAGRDSHGFKDSTQS